jgi:hypothetical protein
MMYLVHMPERINVDFDLVGGYEPFGRTLRLHLQYIETN